MIDLVLVGIVGYVAWNHAQEGAWNACINFFCTLFAGLIAMCFFEPLANQLEIMFRQFGPHFDVVCLLGLFAGFAFLLRYATEQIVPDYVMVSKYVDQPVAWISGLANGYLTAAIVLTALHTALVPRDWLGFEPERNNFLGLTAPDREWLGFVQYVTEGNLGRPYPRPGGAPGSILYRSFDNQFLVLPVGEKNAANQYPNSQWSSFPHRYAARRQKYGAVVVLGKSAAPAPAQNSAPVPAPANNPTAPSAAPGPSPSAGF